MTTSQRNGARLSHKSRAQRDRVNAKVMKEMAAMGEDMKDMPFDPKRMAYGGFQTIVE